MSSEVECEVKMESAEPDQSTTVEPEQGSPEKIGGAKRKRKHRRGKKYSRRRRERKAEDQGSDSGSSWTGDTRTPTRPVLRPLRVPKAPKNFTQFIIDDHENSSLFWDFESGLLQHPGGSMTPDDDSYWAAYSKSNFENMYRDSKEENLMTWSREDIIKEMKNLEERLRTLKAELAMIDPKAYIYDLQQRLLFLQDENHKLKSQRKDVSVRNHVDNEREPSTSDRADSLSSEGQIPDSALSADSEEPSS